jgi:hypothetical protein
MIVETKHGSFSIVRKGAVAISAVRCKHRVRHHRVWREEGDIVHVEHRKKPTCLVDTKQIANGWGQWLATYDMQGNRIILSDWPYRV